MLRTVKDPASRIHHHALLEREESIQASLMEVVNTLLRGTIEVKRAELILRALNTRRPLHPPHQVQLALRRHGPRDPQLPAPPLEQIDEEAAAAKARAEKRAEAERARAAYLAAHQASRSRCSQTISRCERSSHTRQDTSPNQPQKRSSKKRKDGESGKRQDRSSEGAQACSSRRKPWVSATQKGEQAPNGVKETEENSLRRQCTVEACSDPSTAAAVCAHRAKTNLRSG